jgi:hypothetical protein
VTVELYDAAGTTLLATATTDADGNYIFSNDPAGTTTGSHKYNILDLNPDTNYVVRIPNVSGGNKQGVLGSNVLTIPNTGSGADTSINDSDGRANGISADAAVDATDIPLSGANNHSFDFGFCPPVSLGSVIWLDSNDDGKQDANETGIDGLIVELLDGSGTPVVDKSGNPVTTTASNGGQYYFGDLMPGTYKIRVKSGTTSLSHYVMNSAVQNKSSNADDNVANDSNIASGDATNGYLSAPITLSIGAEPTRDTEVSGLPNNGDGQDNGDDANGNMTLDMGFALPKASIGDTVWYDDNKDGIQDTNEGGVENVKVTLKDANGNVVATTQTNANGH